MAKDYAWVTTAAGDPVAKLAKGGADWKLDSIAGYEECA
jgi:hypothetical protein